MLLNVELQYSYTLYAPATDMCEPLMGTPREHTYCISLWNTHSSSVLGKTAQQFAHVQPKPNGYPLLYCMVL